MMAPILCFLADVCTVIPFLFSIVRVSAIELVMLVSFTSTI